MLTPRSKELWFLTGSQQLYGAGMIEEVAAHSREIATAIATSPLLPVPVVFKCVLTTADAIRQACLEANADPQCAGLIVWMHTFSPAKMWIAGLASLQKPWLHLHTQYNAAIPWAEIDMDFMNLNQSAHGDREFGFIGTRMGLRRKVVVGHWADADVQADIGAWARVACAWADMQGARVARFGDNMRNVAVTEGDKVEAQIRLGCEVHGFGVGDLAERVRDVSGAQVGQLLEEYDACYDVAPELRAGGPQRDSLCAQARVESALRLFLEEGHFSAFTTTFEDLHGLDQLPGLAVQRLMADGYGFGAEGDWKTAALVRAVKVMSAGLPGGVSFMEDYTYHLVAPQMKVLGAHMLEVCPSIAADRPRLENHPLSIGGKADPPRLVFDTATGPALNASLVDLGNRFRLLVNEVDVVGADAPLPRLPVARAVWVPRPDLKRAAAAWILAGGAHHTVFSQALTAGHLEDFAEMAGIECVVIDASTELGRLAKELRWNHVYYLLSRGS